MRKMFWTIFALATALVSLIPGVSAAGKNLNHNQTALGVCRKKLSAIILALAAALVSIPSLSSAGHNLNHNQTTLRG